MTRIGTDTGYSESPSAVKIFGDFRRILPSGSADRQARVLCDIEAPVAAALYREHRAQL
jgi:hypothetical protein